MSENIITLSGASIFQKDELILKSVSFTIKKGEFVFLIGKTGSGKSSLLKTLYADIWLAHGHGEVAGFELESIKQKEKPYLRRKIGIVFQDFQLLSDRNVERNLYFFLEAMGWKDKDEMKIRIDEVLALVSLESSLTKMPHQLSGGEQQRISIARALLNNPEIILADEPTGNLDPEKSIEILNLFLKINRELGTAVLMATHELELISKFPHRTLFCEKGVVEDFSQGNF